MEGPLLSKNEHIDGEPPSLDEHIVGITNEDDSASTTEQTPQERIRSCPPCTKKYVWNSIDIVVTLVQIAATIVVTRARNQHPEETVYRWTMGYTWVCIASLPILCWRFWRYDSTYSSDSEMSTKDVRKAMKKVIDCYFVFLVIYLIWYFVDNPSALHDTTPHFWLCMAFLTSSSIRHVIPNFPFAAVLFILPIIFRLEDLWDSYGPSIMAYIGCIVLLLCCICGFLKCICGGCE